MHFNRMAKMELVGFSRRRRRSRTGRGGFGITWSPILQEKPQSSVVLQRERRPQRFNHPFLELEPDFLKCVAKTTLWQTSFDVERTSCPNLCCQKWVPNALPHFKVGYGLSDDKKECKEEEIVNDHYCHLDCTKRMKFNFPRPVLFLYWQGVSLTLQRQGGEAREEDKDDLLLLSPSQSTASPASIV